MKIETPYIIFALGQTVGFCVWLVAQNIYFNKKITKMETQIEALQKDKDEISKEQKEFVTKLSVLSELMAVCKNTVDWMLSKQMKKGAIGG